jgi:hypothetical protein
MSLMKIGKNHKSDDLPAPPALPARLSHRAAAVRDEVERLEAELEATHAWGQGQEQRAIVAEKLCAELREEYRHRSEDDARELAHTRDNLDKYQREAIGLRTRLEGVASSILEVLRPAAKPPMPEAVAAVEQALAPQETQ